MANPLNPQQFNELLGQYKAEQANPAWEDCPEGHCGVATEDFTAWMGSMGHEAYDAGVPASFGNHYAAVVPTTEGEQVVDWTARQFYPTRDAPVPLVRPIREVEEEGRVDRGSPLSPKKVGAPGWQTDPQYNEEFYGDRETRGAWWIDY